MHLEVGDWVQVRSASEILATLDERGTLDFLPFMPEMLRFIGKRYRVVKRATKTCDTIDKTGFRRVKDTVMLEGLRCDGSEHGACQAGCMLFWKEQWLKKVAAGSERDGLVRIDSSSGEVSAPEGQAYSMLSSRIRKVTQSENGTKAADDPVYMCLITEMKRASLPMAWWDVRHYVEDITCGNRLAWDVLRRILLDLFNWVQKKRGGVQYPFMEPGTLKKTPNDNLNLQPGDLVQVKSPEEIMCTLDENGKTRGLRFDVGMFRYCGGQYRVYTRALRLIDQKTGKMIRMAEQVPCILLEGALCHSDFQKFCPRSEFLFWREVWLRKVS